ncbi:MAG: DUF4838 domain-containing protein [Ignavibacteriae bacterium]|nr:DUF4838 domain-containing protein [Ignavibacteriota bacterium]
MKNNCYVFVISILFIAIISGCKSEIELVENNSSKYNIVISENANDIEKHSAEELQKYIKEISDVELKIVADNIEENDYEILIGNTNRIKNLEIKNIDSLGLDGFSIKTFDNKIVILGGKKKGTLYGVYTFLDNILGCKMYTPDAIEIPKNETITIPEISITEVPKIIYRELHLPSARSSQLFCDWHKLHHVSERNKNYGSFVHTFENLIPSDKYFKTNPEYFSEINGIRIPHQQLCLTNPNVFKIVIEELKRKMAEKPEAEVWDVSQNDNFGVCMCQNCSNADSIYQSPAGTMIEFVNKVAREFPNKTISTLAYQYTRKAPIGIKPEPNVMVVLCTIECDRSKPIAENKNDLFNRDIQEWSKLTNNIKIWDYVVQFSSYTDPFPNFHVLQPNVKMFVDHGVKYLFEQGSGDSWSDFHDLKAYVLAELMWNPDVDVNAIMNEYFDGYFGNASSSIKEYFNLIQTNLIASGDHLIIYGYPSTGKASYLKPELLEKYSKILDDAENAVKDNQKYLNRIKTARLPLDYAILELSKLNVSKKYSIFEINNNTVSVKQEMKERLINFVETAKTSGIKALHERGTSPDEYYSSMQKYFNDGFTIHKAYKKNVNVLSKIHPNYLVKGNETLTDGTIGEANYFFNWLGFEENEFEAIVDLEESTIINSIRTNFLQEIKSWIWLPKSVEYFISDDNVNFKKIGEVKNKIDEHTDGIFTESFSLTVKNAKARFIKVKTQSLINCPRWHIGYNNGKGKAFLFVDEIIVN